MRASRPGTHAAGRRRYLAGLGPSLWTNAQDMVDACKLLGVDVMTGHWEFTYGMQRVQEIIDKDFGSQLDFVAQTSRPPISAIRCSSPM
jgi:sulfur-oxidizing protein SoxB